MRSIKYRALMNPEWVKEPYWIYGEADYRSDFKENEMPLEKFHRHIRANRALRETMTQFTGLLDKKGVEIYEGDIVKAENYTDEIASNLGRFYMKGLASVWNLTQLGSLEVIGNIYEHPHLLNGNVE